MPKAQENHYYFWEFRFRQYVLFFVEDKILYARKITLI